MYCAGCNERFLLVSVVGACPRCGAKVDPVSQDELVETLLFKDHSEAPLPDQERPPVIVEELDRLIGKQLHVYDCESLLGCGGMGRVYLARHGDLQRMCALKVLSPRLAAHNADYVTRFQQEGRAAAALVHPNIVTTHAIGESRGYHFLEMEFVAGQSLQQLIEYEGRLTPVRATALAVHIAEGLSAAHQGSVVHRDLKPDNVMLTHLGVPKLADFGLAKRVLGGRGPAKEPLVGTPHFMAPELFNRQPASPTSDVYALGVCYFLLLTGRFPYLSGSLSELKQAASTQPLPNVRALGPEITLEMAECLSLLMAKAPRNRPRDGIEAAQLLHAVSGEVRDVESLLREAFGDTPSVSWSRSGTRYRVEVMLPDARSQTMFVEPSDNTSPEKLLLLYSICCNARPEYYEEALRLNSDISHGSLAIREIDGEAKFVMINSYPRASVDAEEVRCSVLEIASRADAVEKLLTGLDRY